MKKFLKRYRENIQRQDQSFMLGWLGMLTLYFIGNAMNISEHGLLSWASLLYVLIGISIFMIGQKWADFTLRNKTRLTHAKGYTEGTLDTLASFDRWNGRP